MAGHLEFVELSHGDTLAEADEPISFAYFPESGVISIVAISLEGQHAETGLIGREGFVHPALVLGSDRVPNLIQVQVAGKAYRMPTADLVAATESSSSLLKLMLLFAQAHSVQNTFTTLSNAV